MRVAHCNTARYAFETSILNICNIRLKTDENLETCVCSLLQYVQRKDLLKHPDETFANIRLKNLKHLKYRLATCIFCYCNIYNIQDLLLQNLDEKHLKQSLKRTKHLKHSVRPRGHDLPGGGLW
jgi:hypothetical protein